MSEAPIPAAPAPAPKADPGTLVLRAVPGRVTRFRRSAIVAIAAAGSIAIVGAAWLALKPPTLTPSVPNEDRQLAAKTPADALAGAPSDYGDVVPQLGPPLPGDLGRPILNHQRELALADPTADPAAGAAVLAAQQAEGERQRFVAERRAARESGLLVQLAGVPTGTSRAAPATEAVNMATTRETFPARTTDGDPDPNGQLRKNGLVGRDDGDEDTNPHGLTPPRSPWTLHAGSIIAASLITAINSDLPGLVTAQVTEHVYDSVTGGFLLIPQGSRLIGRYDSVVAFGQSRALVLWQRIILPDGSSIRIDNVPASDTQGHAGLADRIDRHTWQLLKGVALSTLLGVGTELSSGDADSDLVRALQDSAQRTGARAGEQVVTRYLEVQPTIRIRPGWALRIVVHKDLVLPRPWGKANG